MAAHTPAQARHYGPRYDLFGWYHMSFNRMLPQADQECCLCSGVSILHQNSAKQDGAVSHSRCSTPIKIR